MRHLFFAMLYPLLICVLSCRSNGDPYTLKVDPRSSEIIHTSWNLYSRDIIDSTAKGIVYIERALVNGCLDQITFLDNGLLEQKKSCSNTSTTQNQGTWHWYQGPGPGLTIRVVDSLNESETLNLYRYFKDSLQFESQPIVDPNTGHLFHYTQTFIPQP